jgi:hydroxyethylthiazole kinase-like uncharacterized protein yjeF
MSSTIVTSESLRDWPIDGGDGGKSARGTALMIGGAIDTPGAVMLAGAAALRAGAGRLTIATVEQTAVALAVATPEAAVVGLPAGKNGSLDGSAVDAACELLDDADAVLIGPGMRNPEASRDFVSGVLANFPDRTPVVLDAMGMTCGAVQESKRWNDLAGVVTPNSTEADHLLDRGDSDDRDPVEVARELADKLGCVAVFSSRVATPAGDTWTNESGNRGLGTGGSGDVLAGIVAGLLARGADPTQAAVWAVHLHSQAGERLAERMGHLGFLARELPEEVPAVMRQLEG